MQRSHVVMYRYNHVGSLAIYRGTGSCTSKLYGADRRPPAQLKMASTRRA
jgi:hypothetical protein